MNNWSLFILVALALVFASECYDNDDDDDDDDDEETDVYFIDSDKIVFNISDAFQSIYVTWWIQDDHDIDPKCFRTQVQYRSHCVKDWKSVDSEQKGDVGHLNLSTISIKMNYDFRIRMNNFCLRHSWSNWTKIQSWGKMGACRMESTSYLWVYILVTVLPLTAFLLICLLSQQGIRKLILPKVPDPRHFKSKIIDVDQSQWWGNLTQRNDDCTTTDIEIIEKSERKEQHKTLVTQPIDTIPEQYDSTYCIYSPETLDGNIEVGLPVLGYIALQDQSNCV